MLFLSRTDVDLDSSNGIALNTAGNGEVSDSIGAGDLNNDGFDDLLITANDVTETEYVVFGRSSFDDGNDGLIGTDGDDFFPGTAGDDVIDGRGGNDRIDGLGGNDRLLGRRGDDVINGGAGNDQLLGGLDNDTLDGTLDGSDGDDTVNGGDGDDIVLGRNGSDTLRGAAGRDFLYGSADNDSVFGGIGSDYMEGGDGDDFLDGGEDNDFLLGGLGNDSLNGQDGDDRLIGAAVGSAGNGERDRFLCGTGADTFVLGDADNVFYASSGDEDFGLIDDFNLSENDIIQLNGSSNYAFRVDNGSTSILLIGNGASEVVGTVTNVVLNDFSSGFTFVG